MAFTISQLVEQLHITDDQARQIIGLIRGEINTRGIAEYGRLD